jgi:hypothetical protein
MLTLGFMLLGLSAWLTALFGPPFLALWFWHTVRRRLGGWMGHPLFIACAVAVEWAGVRILFFAAHDDGNGPPGLRLALILPFTIFVGTIALYYTSVAWVAARSIWRGAHVF